MNSVDLIRATLALEDTPRMPFSFWTHFPGTDLDPEAIARESARFAREAKVDFIKSMPNGLYCVEDWGVEADYSDILEGGAARVVGTPIHAPEDWKKIRRLDPHSGALGRELRHLELLLSEVGPDVPVLATAFSPLTIAKKLCPDDFDAFIEGDRSLSDAVLSEIAVTTRDFIRSAIELGCAGVFFAVQDATPEVGKETYASFGRPYDFAALEGAAAGWFNAVHVHGDSIIFDVMTDYPVHALNWHIGETAPSIAEYRASGGRKAVLGGIQRYNLTRSDMEGTHKDLAAVRAADNGRGVIVSPGCVIRRPVDMPFLVRIADELRSGG
jgi:uroporphyrinogen decarboxylase